MSLAACPFCHGLINNPEHYESCPFCRGSFSFSKPAPIQGAPQWLKDRHEALRKLPPPTLEEVRLSFAASAAWQQKYCKEHVIEALNNALQNGWDFRFKPALEIAEDMAEYCQPLEMERPENLVPHIEEWQKQFKHENPTGT